MSGRESAVPSLKGPTDTPPRPRPAKNTYMCCWVLLGDFVLGRRSFLKIGSWWFVVGDGWGFVVGGSSLELVVGSGRWVVSGWSWPHMPDEGWRVHNHYFASSASSP